MKLEKLVEQFKKDINTSKDEGLAVDKFLKWVNANTKRRQTKD